MSDAAFARLCAFLERRTGLRLGPEKRYLAESRLAGLMRAERPVSFDDLVLRALSGSRPGLETAIVDAMMTNETFFFRDAAFFADLETRVLPNLLAARAAGRRLRVWSAACSTGQEPYSLAMLLAGMAARLKGWSVEILATDVSTAAVARGAAGLYTRAEVQRGLPVRRLLAHFDQEGAGWRIRPELRTAVTFRTFNLLDDVRPLGTFDLVLCRNALIYFRREAKADVLRRLAGTLAADGTMCLGGSESAFGLTADLQPDGVFHGVFVRAAGPLARPWSSAG